MQQDRWRWWQFKKNKNNYYIDEQLIERLWDTIDKQKEQLEEVKDENATLQILSEIVKEHKRRIRHLLKKDNAWLIIALEVKYHVGEVHRLIFELFNAKYQKQGYYHYANIKLEAEQDCNRIYITDITGEDINRGYGSMLMLELIDYAKTNKIAKITGNLEWRDLEDHSDRLLHFYNKFGFVITDLEHGRKYIELKL